MNVQDVVDSVESTQHFKEWKKQHPDAYLSSIFSMYAEQPETWSVNYFDPITQKLSSFTEAGAGSQEDPFSKEEMVPELQLVQTPIPDLLSAIKHVISETYKNTPVNKYVTILQTLDQKTTWNITAMTKTMKIINIHFDESLNLIAHKETSMSDFIQQ